MNYYIDFDNTLYNTPLLKEKLLKSIAKSVYKQIQIAPDEVFQEAKLMFNNNIYFLAEYFSKKYNIELSFIVDNLNRTIFDEKELVFKDSIPFLERLKASGHQIYLLSYSKDSLQYQSNKIAGSGLLDFFDAIYITSIPKYELDIDYSNGIFIDDNPDDLIGLYSKNAKKVIRIRRKGIKYSAQDINNNNIEEYENFNELM